MSNGSAEAMNTCTFCKTTYEPNESSGLYMHEPVCADCADMFAAAQARVRIGPGPSRMDFHLHTGRAAAEQQLVMESPFSLPQAEAILYGASRILQGKEPHAEPAGGAALRRRAREVLGVE